MECGSRLRCTGNRARSSCVGIARHSDLAEFTSNRLFGLGGLQRGPVGPVPLGSVRVRQGQVVHARRRRAGSSRDVHPFAAESGINQFCGLQYARVFTHRRRDAPYRLVAIARGSGASLPRHQGYRECGLTPRSSGAPTACHAGHQALGLRPILRLLSSVTCRRRPLSSNVRPHQYTAPLPLLCATFFPTTETRNIDSSWATRFTSPEQRNSGKRQRARFRKTNGYPLPLLNQRCVVPLKTTTQGATTEETSRPFTPG